MEDCKDWEWLDMKELDPLQFMGYVAEAFKQATGHHLKGLKGYTEWIQAKGYYHWKVAQLKQLKHFPHFKGLPVPPGPLVQPSQ